MIKSSKLLASLLLLVSLLSSACASFKVSDFEVNVTLPASKDCYGFNVVSGKETRLDANSTECQNKKLKSVWLDYENYKKLRSDILRNCQMAKCKEITGAFDHLFLTLDEVLQKIPSK